MVTTIEHISNALHDVRDPEIPGISVIDLGVITKIDIKDEKILIQMTPTFVGCPAIQVMKEDVQKCLSEFGEVIVTVNYDIPWDSNRITEEGLIALKKHGLAPPPRYELAFELDILENIACPHCGSTKTTLQTPFGPTLCRSIHYCNSCNQAFEQFKPL
ncbi:MAG: phenylacetate-CoA oxygenase subunit PaaJ [Bacteroidetes bacterium]|nr:phenylacetate-CoA oxygenase subunit PaaJ [Bacteroidota bacterium]